MSLLTIQTKNLIVVPHLPRHLRALLRGAEEFESTAGLRVADGIRDQLLSASPDFIARLQTAKEADPWRLGFGIIHKHDSILMGMCGFPGPPNAEGIVEIAYGIAPEYQGRGYATEAANALIDFATNDSRVKMLRAHTLPEPNASMRILEKCGFHRADEAMDEGNIVWRWELSCSTVRAWHRHLADEDMR